MNLPGINIYELDEIDINFYVDSILKVGKISAELFVKMMVELDKQYYQYNLCRKQALRKIYNQNDNHV